MQLKTAIRSFSRPLSLAASLLSVAVSADSAQLVHDYTINVDPGFRQLSVEARFAKAVNTVTARDDNASDFLSDPRDCETGEKLSARYGRLRLPRSGIRCLSYSINLENAAQGERRNLDLSPENIMVSPTVWLWRPEINESTDIRVRFHLPDSVNVAVPWLPEGDNTYLIKHSPESASAPAVFGRFEYHEVSAAGAVLRVSLLKSESEIDTQMILNWIKATATDVSLAYGRFPNPSPQVVVIPVGENRERRRRWNRSGPPRAVTFGRVVRDGGESVELFVNPSRPMEDFLGDWTATHEFSHLMLPYISRSQKWISEGFAQYYQNVLLTRSGAYDPQYAWQKLYEGLERGRNSRPDASPNEAASGSMRDGLMKIYWSGAALALMADVELRERSNGEETLDQVLGKLQACCLPSAEVWTGPELMQKLDSMLRAPVFMPLYRRHADTTGFPDVSVLLARLGVKVTDGKVTLRNDAELSGIRSAITAVDPETARWRRKLAAN